MGGGREGAFVRGKGERGKMSAAGRFPPRSQLSSSPTRGRVGRKRGVPRPTSQDTPPTLRQDEKRAIVVGGGAENAWLTAVLPSPAGSAAVQPRERSCTDCPTKNH